MVIVSGTGGKAFCAGGDIVSIYKEKIAGEMKIPAEFFAKEYIVDSTLASMEAI